jgi:hypothetical protein
VRLPKVAGQGRIGLDGAPELDGCGRADLGMPIGSAARRCGGWSSTSGAMAGEHRPGRVRSSTAGRACGAPLGRCE